MAFDIFSPRVESASFGIHVRRTAYMVQWFITLAFEVFNNISIRVLIAALLMLTAILAFYVGTENGRRTGLMEGDTHMVALVPPDEANVLAHDQCWAVNAGAGFYVTTAGGTPIPRQNTQTFLVCGYNPHTSPTAIEAKRMWGKALDTAVPWVSKKLNTFSAFASNSLNFF